MTNQDGKMNEEIIEIAISKFLDKSNPFTIGSSNFNNFLMNKSRQQGIDMEHKKLIEAEKKIKLQAQKLNTESDEAFENGTKLGAEAERKRIIDMIEKMKLNDDLADWYRVRRTQRRYVG